MTGKNVRFLLLFGGLICLPAYLLLAQDVGERVIKRGVIAEDIYVAGSEVHILADVEGDVTTAGGVVEIGEIVRGDVIAAGGTVTISANVGDDVRAAGGEVTVTGNIGDDAIVAGGSVTLAPEVSVGGRAWIAGGELTISGRIGEELRAAGGSIVIAAEINGDVNLVAESVSIRTPAIVRGNLTYRSPRQADVAEGVTILGEITRQPYEAEELTPWRRTAVGAVFFVSLAVATLALYFLFPKFSVAAARIIAASPLHALGLGLAALVTVPFVVILLMASVIGIPLALMFLLLYLITLFVGFLTGIIYVGDAGFRLLQRGREISTGARVLSVIGALVLITLLRFVPFLGALITFALLVFGLGAWTLQSYRTYATA